MSDRPATSALERVLARQRAAVLARDADTLQRLTDAYRPIRARLVSSIDALTAEIAGMTNPTGSQVVRLERARILVRQVDDELTRLAGGTERLVTAGQRQMVVLASENAPILAGVSGAQTASEAARIAAQWTRLNPQAVSEIVGRTSIGSPLRTVLAPLGEQSSQRIADTLTDAVARGINPRETARLLAKQVDASEMRLLTIARTEQLSAFRNATLQNYAANSDILDGWIWTSDKSERTCVACLSLDGQLFPLSQAFFPSHTNCRCSPRPSVRGVDDQVTETGEQWLSRQPEKVQDRVIGSAAGGRAWRDGEVALSDFRQLRHNATWGDSYQVDSLLSARAKAGGRERAAA